MPVRQHAETLIGVGQAQPLHREESEYPLSESSSWGFKPSQRLSKEKKAHDTGDFPTAWFQPSRDTGKKVSTHSQASLLGNTSLPSGSSPYQYQLHLACTDKPKQNQQKTKTTPAMLPPKPQYQDTYCRAKDFETSGSGPTVELHVEALQEYPRHCDQ